jgi:hypothetical protein
MARELAIRAVPARSRDVGQGAESIFRKLQLASSPRGYQLLQHPDLFAGRARSIKGWQSADPMALEAAEVLKAPV